MVMGYQPWCRRNSRQTGVSLSRYERSTGSRQQLMRGKTSKKQTKAVRRFVLRSAAALLLAALHAGCANSGNGIITASATALTTTSPAVASVTDPIARSVQV